ncbi:hypothetical protein EG68_09640 [Paragonimus skrjabini miyazakii]|uniref:Dopamine beta hydroxylase n=1 Tax=Paragonimus skrjabini miyazakii TaxID=59628 RepID=A0A8S9YPX9_9TREM|nr:hypothetical protein EG68_09640 [Paragonimus skrjabini miyazakii]
MEVFLCVGSDPVPPFNGPCNSEQKPMGLRQCRNVIGAWAMGATGLTLPKMAGIPIGGPDSSRNVVIEIHYNNPDKLVGEVDNSGIRFYVTANLRPHDAGIMELGLVYSSRNAIPPGQSEFNLRGYCDSRCTSVGLPSKGIFVFASQLHTHGTGRRVVTYHLRNGRRLPDLNRDDHYYPHFQEIRLLPQPVHVQRGDVLVTQCTYDTSASHQVTFGGLDHSNEMCLNYIFYYPQSQLELCKSEVSQPELDEFLLNHITSGEDTTNVATVEDKFEAIDWKQQHMADTLSKFYSQATVEMHCNSSGGTRILDSPVHVRPVPVPHRMLPVSLENLIKCLMW